MLDGQGALKTKYFPYSSVLDFKCMGHFSYLCKSLYWGRDLLQRGIRWQIGEGNLTAFAAPWIPRAGAFSLLTAEPEDGYPWRVADFFSEGRWNRDLVTAMVSPYDAEVILKIPLSHEVRQDRLVWHFEEDGNYTVRSSYRLARSETCGGPSSSVSMEPRWWKKLWGLQIPPKVKHVVWRAWFDALPSFGSLRGRGVECLPICQFCGALLEDNLHAVWRCSSLQRWVEKMGAIPFKELC